ncbi:hypothetical protein NX773_21300 [Massilia solisilvae]|uniref:Uncharacterized protein n=1 Tax=Massilia solisilvae TaxID=1811225 RepID=A0ABT2BQN0_9BURK|nr:hypothetical protein [Massilia solisilvae]MCS0610711.1 hypothetical protein [Massilia solisilvae]
MDTTAIVIVVVTAVVPVIAMAWVRRWMRSQQPPDGARKDADET